jgi:hypothetical protein
VRQHVDADAKLAQFARLLVYLGVDADLVQRQRRSQAAYAAAGDHNLHGYPTEIARHSGWWPENTGNVANNSNAREFRSCPNNG